MPVARAQRSGLRPDAIAVPVPIMHGAEDKTVPCAHAEWLGAAQDLTPRAMTVLISGLEKEGLVRRTRHPDDGRVTLVSLTAAGRSLAAQQLLPAGQQAAALFDDLSEQDRAELLRLLGEVMRHLQLRGIETPPLQRRAGL